MVQRNADVLQRVAATLWDVATDRLEMHGPRDPKHFDVLVRGGSLLDVLVTAAKARTNVAWFVGAIGPDFGPQEPQDAIEFHAYTSDGVYDSIDPIRSHSKLRAETR